MKKTNFTKIMTLCLMVFGMLSTLNVQAQCPVGETEVTVDYTVGGFNGENSWVLWDATAGAEVSCGGQNPAAGATVACATDGNDLELHVFETFGDGWCAPAAIAVASSEDGSVNGCNNQAIEFFNGVPAVSGNGSFACGSGTPNGVIAAAFQVACILCEINAPADLTVSSDPGVCGANVTLGLATLSADCDPGDVIINDFNGGGADASGDYPVGSTTVTYSTAGGTVLATTVVTVLDTEAPILGCPSTTSIGLDGGECNSAYFFDVTATDNCPSDPFTAVGPYCDPCVAPTGGSALACTAGPNQIIQIIDAPAGGTEVTEVCFNQESFGSAPTITVNVYAYDGVNVPYDGGGFTPVATATLALSAADDGSCICVPFDAGQVVPAGVTQLAIEIVAPFGRAVQTPATCDGATSAGDLSYIVAPACGLTTPGLFNGIGFNLDASYSISLLPPALEAIPSPTAPNGYNAYESGDLLPIGTHCFQYEATDGAGNLSTCDWCVTVVEFPNPTNTLACNGNINVSVDENCEAIITADMALEGGPYGCYEDYLVTVSGITPASAVVGNGTNSVIIKASQIDGWNGMFGPFEVMVTDPSNGNNSTWCGGWMVEDKFAPTIDCDTVTISCLTDTAPGGATSSGTASATNAEGVSWADGDTGVVGEFDVEVSGIPSGATTDKVTVDINLDHSWMGDVTIDLVSPSGQTVTLIDGNCGINDNVNATFDSDASNGISCAAGATGGPHETCPGDWATFATINNTVQPVGDLSVLAGQGANGTWSVVVSDGVGGDGGCLDASNFSIDVAWTLQGTGAPTVFENCGQFELTHEDNVTNFDCTTGAPFVQVIERTWTVVDQKGNEASCVQVINVTASTLADLTLPPNYDNLDQPALDCSNADTDPSNTGTPGGSCTNISATYEDLVFDDICDGSYKLLRQWTVLDWCTGGIAEHNQTIKVLDTTAPTFGPLADLNESTTTNSCLANVVLPAPALSDDCSDAANVSYTASASAGDLLPANGGYVVYGLPVGTHTVTYEATDDCGNTSVASFDIIVTDDIVPVAICETFHVVNLTTNEPTLVYANTFDDGSYDNCELESMEVRRMGNANNVCIDFDWTTDGPGIDEIPNGSSDLRRDKGVTFWYPAVPFACCDVGEEHMVEFRVTDVNGNSNTCMVSIEVDDKLDPVINGPANATYECSEYINESSDIAIDGLNQDEIGARAYYVELNGPGSADNDTTFVGWYANAFDNCEATVFIRDAGAINECGITTPFINRFYTAIDGGGRTDVAVQRLTVVNSYPYFITDTSPFSPQNRDGVRWPTDRTLTSCDALTDPSATGEPLIQDDLTIFNITVDGVFYSEYPMESTCSQIAVTNTDLDLPVVDGACKKILRTWTVIDWCQYNNNVSPAEGIWTYEQIIKVEDNEGPTIIAGCEDVVFAVTTDNDGNSTNGCTAFVELEITAEDPSVCDSELQYTYWLDYFSDGSQDEGGNTNSVSGTYPMGVHTATWTVEDACGNITTCEQTFTVEDQTAPYVFLASDYITTLNGAGESIIWATEFEGSYSDECSGDCFDFRIGIPSQGPGQTAPPTADSHTFTATGTFTVDWWIKDCSNNWTYVTGTIVVQDNDTPNGPTSLVSGTIGTETGAGVNNVTVNLSSNAPGVMPTATTNAAGFFTFGDLENDMNYTVTPDMDLDPLNGVSTYDLVLISKHILQTQLLDSPYKMIAADVNMNGSITTLDMVELRKLILFIETEFPVESSTWRFVETDYVFPNAANPFQTVFPEETFINGLTADVIADYVAIKKGDVNGSAATGFAGDADGRSFNGELIFNVADRNLVAGNTYTVDFTSNDFNNIMGYQFSLAFDQNAVEIADVQAGELAGMSNGNFGMSRINEGVITTSWNNSAATSMVDDQTVFSVTFTANTNAKLSEVFNVSSRLTAAEAYNANLDLMNVAIEYNDDNNEAVAEFTLLQNTPNPFKGQTVIGFMLPTAANATLSVYDISGKVVRTVSGDFAKGYNEVTLDRSELNSTGVLYYQLQTADYSATKKMIILE